MTNKSQEPLATRLLLWFIVNTLIAIRFIIIFSFKFSWFIIRKTHWMIKLAIIFLLLLFAYEVASEVEAHTEKAIIINDSTPRDERLRDLRGKEWSREDIDWYIHESAKEYKVSENYMHKIIKCESNYVQDVQSRHIQSYGQELSFGLVQIHEPSHPSVSREEATNPEFAIDFLAENLSKGREGMWSCSRMI